MSRGVRIRIAVFVALSALGIVYVGVSYLGLVDRVTGRDLTVTATLPKSGGLFEGSEVTYRGVKIGKVTRMTPTEEGVEVVMNLDHETELPTDSEVRVHNLSAVGEQYLDFLPPDEEPPYAEDGTVFHGDQDSLPVDEGELLVDINDFVQSVDQENLEAVIKELGLMFDDTGRDLQRLLDGGSEFVEEASAHTDETIRLLETGLTVLRTQSGQKENIRSFARDLATLTRTLRDSDGDLRQVLDGTPGTAREVNRLLTDLEPTLPILLSDLTSVGQVVTTHLAGIEQLLVTYPALISGGPTGSTRDGFGHVGLQLDYSIPPCTNGFMPPEQWRPFNDLTDGEGIYPAKCIPGPGQQARGPQMAPGADRGNASPPRVYSGTYDPITGRVPGVVDANGNPVEFRRPGDLSVLGGDAWKWMLVSPVAGR